MNQDYAALSNDELEALEKSTFRMVVQALQEYSREAKDIFDNTFAPSDTEVIVLAEDVTQYALEVAECYPINKRYAGFIDYKRVRWMPTPFGLIPQALLVDAKASKENNRDTLQRSQLPMDADFLSNGRHCQMAAGVNPHLDIAAHGGSVLRAVSTSILVHFYYESLHSEAPPYRNLRSIFILSLPHGRLKGIYNPSPERSFFGQGKHSPARMEEARIRVYFDRLRQMKSWRLQELQFVQGEPFSIPLWRDTNVDTGLEERTAFTFIGR